MAEGKQKSRESDGATAAQDLVGPALIGGAEAVLAAQDEWLTAMEGAVTGWLHRRREGLQQLRQSFERVPRCHTVADFAKLQQEWTAGATRRLAGDLAAWNETATLAAQLTMKHVEEAGRIAAAGSPLGLGESPKAATDKPSHGSKAA